MLIEMLSIIIVISIIAGITIPIVLNVIENSKKGSSRLSALEFKDAISQYYLTGRVDGSISDNDLTGNYDVLRATLINTLGGSDEQHIIPVSCVPPKSGNIDSGDLVSGCLQMDEYAVVFNDGNVSKVEKKNCIDAVDIYARQLRYENSVTECTNVQCAIEELYGN